MRGKYATTCTTLHKYKPQWVTSIIHKEPNLSGTKYKSGCYDQNPEMMVIGLPKNRVSIKKYTVTYQAPLVQYKQVAELHR